MRPTPVVLSRPGAGSPSRNSRPAPFWLRLRILFNTRRLDRELAEGLVPDASEERALRAAQLTEPDRCHRVACSLREVVADAEHPGSAAVSSALPPRRDSVLASRRALFGIAARLEGAKAADVCGVARSRALLTDETGPLYSRHANRSMDDVIAWIEEGFRQS
jgi:hypothetical protein